MRVCVVILLGMLIFSLLAIPVVMTAPVAAQDTIGNDTPVPDQNVTVTQTPVPDQTVTVAETPASDQNVTVTQTPVPDQTVTVADTPVPDQNVTVTQTLVPDQTVSITPTPVAPGGMTITIDNYNIGFNKLHFGDNDWCTGITVDTTYSSWSVKIIDSTGSANPGYMIKTTDPSVHLANPLMVKSIDTATYGGMNPPFTIWTGNSPGKFSDTLCLRQHVDKTDLGGSYDLKFDLQGGAL